ncbi:MAG: glycosyltransferase, partial [Bacteroidales bacterium]|nr:glycosyltransferase [Bacteroidales bacterium]
IRLMKKGRSILNTRLILINYLNEGLTTTHRKASLKERYRIMAKHYGHLSTLLHHAWFVVRSIFL